MPSSPAVTIVPAGDGGGGQMALWQVLAGGERRLARGPAGPGPQELLPASLTIDGLLGGAPGALAAALGGPAAGPGPAGGGGGGAGGGPGGGGAGGGRHRRPRAP